MKIGAITVGQAPRVDVTADIMDLLGEDTELLERGGLDGLTRGEIEKFKPEEGDYILVSRLTDGSEVTFAERHIIGRLQEAIDGLEAEGVKLIMVFCTGEFPAELTSNVPMIFPNDLLHRIVPLLSGKSSIVAVSPSPLQIEQSNRKWSQYVDRCVTFGVSPYGPISEVEKMADRVAKELEGMDADVIVLDCIGFTLEMKRIFAEKTGKIVVLPRTLLARVAAEAVC